MNRKFVRFWYDDRGAEMLEWAVVAIILLGLTMIAVLAIKDELVAMYGTAFDAIQQDPPDNYEDT